MTDGAFECYAQEWDGTFLQEVEYFKICMADVLKVPRHMLGDLPELESFVMTQNVLNQGFVVLSNEPVSSLFVWKLGHPNSSDTYVLGTDYILSKESIILWDGPTVFQKVSGRMGNSLEENDTLCVSYRRGRIEESTICSRLTNAERWTNIFQQTQGGKKQRGPGKTRYEILEEKVEGECSEIS